MNKKIKNLLNNLYCNYLISFYEKLRHFDLKITFFKINFFLTYVKLIFYSFNF